MAIGSAVQKGAFVYVYDKKVGRYVHLPQETDRPTGCKVIQVQR